MAPYQLFKLSLVKASGVSKDGFHILLGYFLFIFVAFLFKAKLSNKKLLIAPVLFALLLEALDVRDALTYGQRVDILGSLRDIVITTILPVLTVLYAKRRERGSKR